MICIHELILNTITNQFKKYFFHCQTRGIYKKRVEQAYCITDNQFLPDRYVEGICPNCGSNARGDQCDNCSLILDPLDLLDKMYFAIEKCREMQLKMQRFATHLIPFRQCVGQSIALAMKRDDMGVMNQPVH